MNQFKLPFGLTLPKFTPELAERLALEVLSLTVLLWVAHRKSKLRPAKG